MPTQNPAPTNEPPLPSGDRQAVLIWAATAAVLAVALLAVFAYAQHQRKVTDELSTTNQTLNAAVTQMQEQLQSMTERLNQRIEAETAKAAAAPPPVVVRPAARKPVPPLPPAEPAPPPKDPRVDQLQSELKDQQSALANARDDLEKTRAELHAKLDTNRDELDGSIGRARDDFNSSIAHTHEELVALQKRGARNYFEFSLNKSKQFQKVGPVSVELRKVDFKHKSYDLAMLVDDFTIQKKRVNLYEPVWINLNDTPEPVQLIVNQIDKDKVAGYIAAPKFRKFEVETPAAQ